MQAGAKQGNHEISYVNSFFGPCNIQREISQSKSMYNLCRIISGIQGPVPSPIHVHTFDFNYILMGTHSMDDGYKASANRIEEVVLVFIK